MRLCLSVILYLTACFGCAPMPHVPMVERPDTREITGVIVDSAAFVGSLDIFRDAMPNEAAVCYTGELRDSVLAGESGLILHLTGVERAQQDSASLVHVWFHGDGPVAPCVHPIGVGHSHPNASYICDQSSDDAMLLFTESRVLVSLAWCLNGDIQILYQDGRRDIAKWRS